MLFSKKLFLCWPHCSVHLVRTSSDSAIANYGRQITVKTTRLPGMFSISLVLKAVKHSSCQSVKMFVVRNWISHTNVSIKWFSRISASTATFAFMHTSWTRNMSTGEKTSRKEFGQNGKFNIVLRDSFAMYRMSNWSIDQNNDCRISPIIVIFGKKVVI
jgi:hypothetical protein